MEESDGRLRVKRLELVPIGAVSSQLLDFLRLHLSRAFRAECIVLPAQPEPGYAFNAERQQYCSTEILSRVPRMAASSAWRVLALTCLDLYIPILTFVFGEAQLDGSCAVVSAHRLRQEMYGLPPDQMLLRERLLKEAVHELGHTFGLTHCAERTCVMASSHSVERIDLKTAEFCPACLLAVLGQPGSSPVESHFDL